MLSKRWTILWSLAALLCWGAPLRGQEDSPKPNEMAEKVIAIKTVTNTPGTARKPTERVTYVYKDKLRVETDEKWVLIDLAHNFTIWVDPSRKLALPFTLAELHNYRQQHHAPLGPQAMRQEPQIEKTDESKLLSGYPCTKVIVKQGLDTEMIAWVAEGLHLGIDWEAWERINEDRILTPMRRLLREEVKGLPLMIELKTSLRDIPIRVTQRSAIDVTEPDKVSFDVPKEQWIPEDYRQLYKNYKAKLASNGEAPVGPGDTDLPATDADDTTPVDEDALNPDGPDEPLDIME